MAMPRIRIVNTPSGQPASAGPASFPPPPSSSAPAPTPTAGAPLPPSPASPASSSTPGDADGSASSPSVVNVHVPPPVITFHAPPLPSWAAFPPIPPSAGGAAVSMPAPGGTPPPLPVTTPAGTPPQFPAAGSSVSAFDRPIPVVVMGPRELIEGRGRGTAPARRPREELRRPPPRAARATRGVGKAFGTAGRAGAALARGSGAGALSVAAEGAAGALSKLGPAGMVAGAAVDAVSKGFKAVADATDAFVQRARELEQFSGQLASANAQADIIRMQNEIREAQDLEGPLSELAVNQAKLEATLSELLRPIKDFVVVVLNGAIEFFTDAITGILSGLNELLGFFMVRSDKIDRMLARMEGGEPVKDLMDLWMLDAEFGERGVPARPHRDDEPAAVGPRLDIPLLAGGGP